MPGAVFLPPSAVPPAKGRLARELFVCDLTADADVKIREVTSDSLDWFGDLQVPLYACPTIMSQILARAAGDGEILDDLDGEVGAETTLSLLWHLLSRQDRGQSGALHNDGRANIFYMRDGSGVLRVIDVSWDQGWCIDANELSEKPWSEGRPVFTCTPIEEVASPK